MTEQTLIWSIIAAVGATDGFLLLAQGMRLDMHWLALAVAIFLCTIAFAYRHRSAEVVSLAMGGAQIVVFSYVGAILTYVAMAASPFPTADALLTRADAALGFDWRAWFQFVNANPKLHFVLAAAYSSIPTQGLVLILYFSFFRPERVSELILAAMLSILIITPLMFVLPAVGAWSQHGVAVEPWRSEIIALRSHTLLTIGNPQGIVTFPSFHTALAILFVNMARGSRLFAPVLVLNLLMVASVPTQGAHFGVDVVGGLAVALVAFAAARALLRRCDRSVVDRKSLSAAPPALGAWP